MVHAATSDQLKANRQKLESIADKVLATQKSLDQTRGEYRKIETSVRQTDEEIGRLSEARTRNQADIAASAERLDALQARQQNLAGEAERYKTRIASQMVATYQAGRSPYPALRVMLSSESPQQLDRMLVYQGYLNQAHTAVIDEIRGVLLNLDEVGAELAEEKIRHEQEQERLQAILTKLAAKQGERDALLVKLEEEIGDDKQQLASLQQNQKQLEALIKEMEKSLANIDALMVSEPFGKQKGKLPWPTRGSVKKSFGSQPKRSDQRLKGISIAASSGQPVKAVHHGRVIFSNWLRGYGQLVIIDHGDQYYSLYGRNQTLKTQVGDEVRKGDNIATVGRSGGYRNPGLYFEIRKSGKAVDPKKWLARN